MSLYVKYLPQSVASGGGGGSVTTGDLTESGSPNLTVTNGAGAVIGSGTVLTLTGATLLETVSSVLTITGGTNAVLGTGVSIQVKQASTSQAGYLSSTDWNTFNNKAPILSPAFTQGSTWSELTTTSGTISVAAAGTAVTGVGTKFLDEVQIGDNITSNSETHKVANILSQTSLVTDAWTGAVTAQAYTLAGGVRLTVYPNGRIQLGGSAATEAAIIPYSFITAIGTAAAALGAIQYSGGSSTAVGTTAGLICQTARGVDGAPVSVKSGDTIGSVAARGYTGTVFSSGRGGIRWATSEDWTDSAQGTQCLIQTTISGGTSTATRYSVDGNGNSLITGNLTISGTLQVNGGDTANSTTASVFTPASGPAGAHTAIQGWLALNINGTVRYLPYW